MELCNLRSFLKFSRGSVARLKNKLYLCTVEINMVDVAQLVRASDCGSEGRGFEPHLPPQESVSKMRSLFLLKDKRT